MCVFKHGPPCTPVDLFWTLFTVVRVRREGGFSFESRSCQAGWYRTCYDIVDTSIHTDGLIDSLDYWAPDTTKESSTIALKSLSRRV